MAFDDILPHIGEMGAFQVCSFITLSMVCFYTGYQALSMIFLGPDHTHWCAVERLRTLPYEQQRIVAIPLSGDGGYESCYVYDKLYENYTDDELCSWDWNNQSTPVSKECSEWVYDYSQYARTAVSDYNLVCDRSFLVGFVYSSWILSLLLAVLYTGVFSDNFGRKPLLCLMSVFGIVASYACVYAPEYASFLTLRFLTGLFLNSANSCAFVLIIESVGNRYREVTGTIYWLFYATGFMLLPVMAHFVTDFRNLQVIMSVIMLPSLTFILIIPESPRWLAITGKTEKALDVLQYIADINQKQLPPNAESIISNEKIVEDSNPEPGKWKILFMNSTMLKAFLIIMPAWISSALVYNGLSFNTGDLSGNIYINTFLSGFMEVPGNLLPMILIYFIGRRKTQIVSLVLAGVFLLLCIPFTSGTGSSVVTALSLIGKVFIVCSYTTIYLFTAELFPTCVRHIAHSICNALANIVSLIAPFMGAPLIAIWTPLPLLIFGLLALATGPLLLLLPETRGDDLPDTLEEAEELWNRRHNRKVKGTAQPEKEMESTRF